MENFHLLFMVRAAVFCKLYFCCHIVSPCCLPLSILPIAFLALLEAVTIILCSLSRAVFCAKKTVKKSGIFLLTFLC